MPRKTCVIGNILRFPVKVGAHYFEEGNVQLDAKHECKDSTAFQVKSMLMFVLKFLYYI